MEWKGFQTFVILINRSFNCKDLLRRHHHRQQLPHHRHQQLSQEMQTLPGCHQLIPKLPHVTVEESERMMHIEPNPGLKQICAPDAQHFRNVSEESLALCLHPRHHHHPPYHPQLLPSCVHAPCHPC